MSQTISFLLIFVFVYIGRYLICQNELGVIICRYLMFFRKYKLLKNNGLLPKIDHPKPQSILTTYCLFQEQKQREYTLLRSPSEPNTLIMFNDKEYLHRKCTFVTTETQPPEILKQIASLFPKHSHTLTIFIANSPEQSDQLLLGTSKTTRKQPHESMLECIYKHMTENQSKQSKIQLSIMGVQGQNSLTDELNLEWMDQHQEQVQDIPLEVIIQRKQKVKVIKNHEGNNFTAENLTKHEITSEKRLLEIIQKYRNVKNHLENWIISTDYTEYFLIGELYHLTQTTSSSGSEQVTLHSHYILRINQYIRASSPLMLRLGINLRRIQQDHSKPVEIHQSKLFKLLSQCFVHRTSKNGYLYRFHLFLQVGQYPVLKDQYLCLVPTSQYLTQNQFSASNSATQSQFFYTKQVMQYPQIHTLISSLINLDTPITAKNNLSPKISGILKARLKTKSYVEDTYSSQEKRIHKYRYLATEESYDRSQLNLEELVYEAAKIYRLPTPKKIQTPLLKDPPVKKKSLKNIHAISYGRSSENVQADRGTNFAKKRQKVKFDGIKKDLSKNKFYQETKEWLGLIYGKNSSKKLKSANKKTHRFDETTSMLIKDMLNKEINGQNDHEIDEVIDRL